MRMYIRLVIGVSALLTLSCKQENPVRGELRSPPRESAPIAPSSTPHTAQGRPIPDQASAESKQTGTAVDSRRADIAWQPGAVIDAPSKEALVGFGQSGAVTEEYLFIGAPGDGAKRPGPGRVHVFRKQTGTWRPAGVLTAPKTSKAVTSFGETLHIRGKELWIGAPEIVEKPAGPGAVFIYRSVGNTWRLVETLTPPDGKKGDGFGSAIATTRNKACIGAKQGDGRKRDTGAVYCFKKERGKWRRRQKLTPKRPVRGGWFGASIVMDDTSLLVGAPRSDPKGEMSGAVTAYRRKGDKWGKGGVLIPKTIYEASFFGDEMALDGDRVVINEPCLSPRGIGAAHVYRRNKGKWIYEQQLKPEDAEAEYQIGESVGFFNGDVLIGAPGIGSIYVFGRNDSGRWTEKPLIERTGGHGRFGHFVATSPSSVLVGDFNYNNPNHPVEGCGVVYE